MTRWLCASRDTLYSCACLRIGLGSHRTYDIGPGSRRGKILGVCRCQGRYPSLRLSDHILAPGDVRRSPKADKPVATLNGVYARPEDVKAYQRDGKFPDGAVIVKEVLEVKSENFTAAEHSYATKIKHWFVMIKDTKGRFKGNALWGEGWGWAFFESKDPKKQVATDYRTECRGCHLPVKKDDWLHVQGFPVLREKGTEK